MNSTRNIQKDFFNWVLNPKENTLHFLQDSNATQYPRLVRNVVEDFIKKDFPLFYQFIENPIWEQLITDLLKDPSFDDPKIWMMPSRFPEFVKNHHLKLEARYPFISDLLEFEWIEVELFMHEDIPVNSKLEGNPLEDKIILNPVLRLFHFRFPVHRIPPSSLNTEVEGDYFLVAFRNRDDQVYFKELTPIKAIVLDILNSQPFSITDIKDTLINNYELNLEDDQIKPLIRFIHEGIESGIFVGYES